MYRLNNTRYNSTAEQNFCIRTMKMLNNKIAATTQQIETDHACVIQSSSQPTGHWNLTSNIGRVLQQLP